MYSLDEMYDAVTQGKGLDANLEQYISVWELIIERLDSNKIRKDSLGQIVFLRKCYDNGCRTVGDVIDKFSNRLIEIDYVEHILRNNHIGKGGPLYNSIKGGYPELFDRPDFDLN